MSSSSATVAPGDLRFLPLLFVVLAIAARLAPERLCGDVRNRRLTSQRYYWSCKYLRLSLRLSLFTISARRSLLVAVAIQPNCLEMIWTRLLVGTKNLREITCLLLVITERSFSYLRPANNGVLEPVRRRRQHCTVVGPP